MDQLELGIALLFVGANALIVSYATTARMGAYAAAFYVIWITGVLILPDGGAQWFWLAVLLATALRSGRLLVKSQRNTKTGATR